MIRIHSQLRSRASSDTQAGPPPSTLQYQTSPRQPRPKVSLNRGRAISCRLMANPSDTLKVFISYSRRDSSDFAEELLAGLELAGFAPFLDRHDIAPGEAWEDRLSGLIQQADTVVYVISPEAVKSERCQCEVDETLALSKRLMPIVFKPVPEADIPDQLRRRQFVRFDTGPGITRPLAQLADALRQDLDWIKRR
jgi:TIR domain